MSFSKKKKADENNINTTTKSEILKPPLVAILFALGLVLRLLNIPNQNEDILDYFEWYDYIVQHGIINAMGDEFSAYAPPYLYLLSLATLTKSFLSKITAIKLIPITFDMINSYLAYKIVSVSFKEKTKPLLAAILIWLAPTVAINSSFWGQTDGIYVCLLLLCIYFFMENRPIAATIGFAVAFAIKVQSVFLLPLLAILFLKRRIRWSTFLLIPLVYFVIMLPSVLAGRSIQSLLFVYYNQSVDFAKPSLNAANFYFFLSENLYGSAIWIGLPLALLIILIWTLFYGLKKYNITPTLILLTALVSVAVTPFVLPKMHDRYFYAADILSLIAFFYIPEIWIVPIAYQVISLLSYLPFLVFGVNPQKTIPIAVLINTITIGYLLWIQWKTISQEESPTPPHQLQLPEK